MHSLTHIYASYFNSITLEIYKISFGLIIFVKKKVKNVTRIILFEPNNKEVIPPLLLLPPLIQIDLAKIILYSDCSFICLVSCAKTSGYT